MTSDGRVWAWAQAWQIAKNIEKLRTDYKKQPVEPPPQLYWGWLAEANIFVQLATADLSVGMGAGAWLEAQTEAEAESAQRTEEFREFMNRRASEKKESSDE